jgi:hypothetical protein
MREVKVRVGKELLGFAVLKDEWSVKELYEALMHIQDTDAASENPKINSMEKFYLKIYGWYNPEITKDHSRCTCCPDNPEYRRFHDYNQLMNDKEQVLVLESNYNDFREFDIYCSYYVNKLDESYVPPVKPDAKTLIEVYGTKKTFWDRIKEKLFAKELCM